MGRNIFDVRCSRCDDHQTIESFWDEDDFKDFICDDCLGDDYE